MGKPWTPTALDESVCGNTLWLQAAHGRVLAKMTRPATKIMGIRLDGEGSPCGEVIKEMKLRLI